jgi:Protein of unknown function (DUF3800)
VFQCYFDDSGKESEPSNRFVVIAGYLAVDEVWGRFQNVWGHLLVKYGLPGVHMKEILGIARQKGWDVPKLNEVLQEFIVAIRAAPALIGFGIAVDADEWRNLSPERRRLFGDAQEFACTRIVRRIRDRLNEAGLHREQMAMFFDQDFEFARRRLTLFEHITKRSRDLRESLTVLSFADARHYYPLQAADLLAWETRRHLINLVGGQRDTTRWTDLMAALPSGVFDYAGEFWDKALIESELPKAEAANAALAASASKGRSA